MSTATALPASPMTTLDISTTEPVPMRRLVGVELRKLVDTRAGRWLLIIQGLLIAAGSLIVTIVAAVKTERIELMDFIGLAGGVMGLLLPVMGILAVTTEWSQRTHMATFTLEPRRVRIVTAKLLATIAAALVSVALAIVLGYLSSGIASIVGVDLDWHADAEMLIAFAVVQVLGLLVGFMFGTLLLNTPGAIICYAAYFTLVPAVLAGAAELMEWFADVRPWIDFANAQMPLNDFGQDAADVGFGAVNWGHFLVSGIVWFVAPMWLGITRMLRAEVK